MDTRHRRQATTLPQGKTSGRSKYGAVKTVVDGVTFDSKAEARRYAELRLMEKAGKLHLLELQPRFTLSVPPKNGQFIAGQRMHIGAGVDGVMVGEWRGDFQYCECAGGRNNCGWTAVVVEDVKGFKTPLYRWKKKHVEAQYGIQIREIR